MVEVTVSQVKQLKMLTFYYGGPEKITTQLKPTCTVHTGFVCASTLCPVQRHTYCMYNVLVMHAHQACQPTKSFRSTLQGCRREALATRCRFQPSIITSPSPEYIFHPGPNPRFFLEKGRKWCAERKALSG